MNHFSFRPVLVLLVVALVFAGAGCTKDGPYVMVDGKRLDEAYLKSKSPEQYNQLRAQYEKQVLGILKNLASKELFELEAKAQGVKPKDYSKKLADSVAPATETEIVAMYNELRANGRIKKESLAEVHGDLANAIVQQRQQKLFADEFARLRKKYAYKVETAEKVVRTTVDLVGEPTTASLQAPVTIVEFTDFRCGYCARVRGTIDRLQQQYGTKLRHVVKDMPYQPGSMQMHKAANCVLQQNQDMYWKYFHLLFAEARAPDATTAAGLEARAAKMGADVGKLRICMQDPGIEAEIQKDVQEGQAAGAQGTPAFFVNGRFLEGAQPLEEFVAVIDEELVKAGSPKK